MYITAHPHPPPVSEMTYIVSSGTVNSSIPVYHTVRKGSHSFTCSPTRSSAIGMSHTCLCLPIYSWYSFIDPGGMEGWDDLGAK